MAVCDIPGCECYGCRLRAKGVGLSSTVTPTRNANRTKVFTKHRSDPAWERGVAGERRPDGSFMPYLTPDRAAMGVKEHGERRREVSEQVGQLKNNPNVFRKEGPSS